MIECPCKDCQNRKEYCHSTCKDYADFRKQLDEIKNAKEKDVYKRYIVDLMNERKRKK